jgi:hypothetical protein
MVLFMTLSPEYAAALQYLGYVSNPNSLQSPMHAVEID